MAKNRIVTCAVIYEIFMKNLFNGGFDHTDFKIIIWGGHRKESIL